MSIRTRLVLLVLLAVAPLAAVQVWNQIELRRDREAELHATAFQLLELLRGEQARLVDGVQQTLSLLAETDAARALDAGRCADILERTRQRIPNYLTINLADRDGTVLCSTDAELTGITIADRVHVRVAIDGDGFTVGEFIRRRPSGTPVMPFGLPVRQDGRVVGVATALIDLGWLKGYLSAHPLPANAALIIADSGGTVLARVPELPDAVGSRLPERFRPLLEADHVGTRELLGIDGHQRVFAYVPLSAGIRHIFVAVGIDRNDALASIDQALWRSLVLTAATLLAGLSAALLLARRSLLRPIAALVATTRRWRAGDLGARSGAAEDRSEIGALGRAFDDLAGDLATEVRARERAAADLRASEARHRAIVETAVDAMVVIDERGTVQSCNPATHRLFGYTEGEVVGRNVAMLMPEPYWSEHAGYIDAYLQTAVRRIIGIGREVEGRRKDGSVFPLELAVTEWTLDGRRFFTGIMRDISLRRTTEKALRASEERFRAMVEDAPQMMWVNRADGTLEFVNAAFRAYTGRETNEASRMDDVHPDDVERIQAVRHLAIAAGTPHEYELRLRRSDGEYRWHLSRTNPVRQDGRLVAWFGGAVDVHDIQRACEAAEDADRSKSRFLAAASHDLRQPLQSLLLFAEALRPHIADRAGANKLAHLLNSLDILKGLLDGLLDISRLDAGIVEPQTADFPVREILDQMADAYAPVAIAKGLRWAVEACGGTVRSDPILLGRIVRNLVENALRYTSEGAVEIRCVWHGERLLIEVHDTGCGIPAEQVGRIFDEFYQVGNSERDRSQGLGLGLAIVRRLSRLLDHPIGVRSNGGGSVFSVSVPVTAAAPSPPPSPPEPEGPAPPGFAVVIDDDAIVLQGLQALLSEWGYDVLTAESTDDALQQLDAAGRRPAILIVDYRLRAGRVGTEAVVRIRERYGADIPGIVVTGEIGAEPQKDAAALGLGLMHKPVKPRLLEAEIARQMQRTN